MLPAAIFENIQGSMVIILVGLAILTIFLTFILPIFFRTEKIRFALPYFFKKVRKNTPLSLFLASVVIISVTGIYYIYTSRQQVRILSAAQFKEQHSEAIKLIQEKGLGASSEAKLYLLDIRSRDDYAKDHLVGSASEPAQKAISTVYPIEKIDLVIYSKDSEFSQARQIADSVKRNGELAKDDYKDKMGKIYVVKDGFEGLKNAGLATETGGWD